MYAPSYLYTIEYSLNLVSNINEKNIIEPYTIPTLFLFYYCKVDGG